MTSLFGLPDEVILTPLFESFPCREHQIRSLATLLHVRLLTIFIPISYRFVTDAVYSPMLLLVETSLSMAQQQQANLLSFPNSSPT